MCHIRRRHKIWHKWQCKSAHGMHWKAAFVPALQWSLKHVEKHSPFGECLSLITGVWRLHHWPQHVAPMFWSTQKVRLCLPRRAAPVGAPGRDQFHKIGCFTVVWDFNNLIKVKLSVLWVSGGCLLNNLILLSSLPVFYTFITFPRLKVFGIAGAAGLRCQRHDANDAREVASQVGRLAIIYDLRKKSKWLEMKTAKP